MKKIFPLICTLAVMMSCNNNEGNPAVSDVQNDSTGNANRPVDFSGCYISVIGRDTFAAHFKQQERQVTGRLSFDNYEKDGSSGTVNGRIDGNIISLTYLFQSEGMQSVMDVYFKMTGDTMVRGIGEMNARGDTAYFVDPGAIQYEGSVFKKIPCEELNEKYK
ncbi:MAG: hypothetical protein ACXWB9_05775 [Flavisolibacter sp.]